MVSGFGKSKPGMRTALLACLVLFVIGAAACSEISTPPCPEGTDRFIRYQLFMGRSGQDGEVVDDAEWDAFLRDTVTPRFPDGLTVLDAQGQWRDTEGFVQRERSKLLVILVPPDDDWMRRIDEVSDEYQRRFMQESVLQVVDDTCVSFS